MGQKDLPPLPPSKPLSAEDRARVLDKLYRLETAALFTPGWDALAPDLARWRRAVTYGRILCADVPRLAAALEAHGVEKPADLRCNRAPQEARPARRGV